MGWANVDESKKNTQDEQEDSIQEEPEKKIKYGSRCV